MAPAVSSVPINHLTANPACAAMAAATAQAREPVPAVIAAPAHSAAAAANVANPAAVSRAAANQAARATTTNKISLASAQVITSPATQSASVGRSGKKLKPSPACRASKTRTIASATAATSASTKAST